MKRTVVICLCFLFFMSCKNQQHSQSLGLKEQKPNIIIILVDDAGYVDFGFMGSADLDTPHIDQLAKAGVVFTDAHVSSTVCAPSRAGLLTGQYQQRSGFEANGTGFGGTGDIGLADHVTTIAEIFKNNAYNTMALGKWHLGHTASDHPNQRGFNEFYGFLGGSRSYFPIKNPSHQDMLQYNGERVHFEGYLTDVLGDKSIDFIEKNKENPFFMYLAFNAVHTPMEAKKEHLEKYKDHPRQLLAAMTWSLDENIGKLTTRLKALDLFDNTLIYFLSDNGGAHNNQSEMGPLKGWKGNAFEGGHRVPFIMSWPDSLKGGKQFHGLTSAFDIAKTSFVAAGIPTDTMTLDGVDLMPYLTHLSRGNPHDNLYWRKLDDAAARLGAYKLIKLNDYGEVMYNLSEDLGEMKDISDTAKDTFDMLYNNLKNWENEMMNPLWREGKPWEEITYDIHKRLMQNKPVLYKSPSQKKKYIKNQ